MTSDRRRLDFFGGNAAAYRSKSAGVRPSASGTTTVTAVAELSAKSDRSWLPT